MNTETDPVAPRYITHIRRLALPQPFSGSLWSEPVKIMKDVWLEIKDGQILRIGPEGQPAPPDENDSEAFNADGMMVTPGLIDAHTHPIFVDSRQAEFVRRCRGETYQQIAADGGGIITSIRGVRAADQEKLSGLILERLDGFLNFGVTSIEAKSGYGLSFEDELKSLRALQKSAEDHPVEVSPTLLAAHVVPPEFQDNPDGYVDLICRDIIPQ
ncbi:MAG TPA: imidazolonepropionase, partial [Bacteroidetes bacterium]|nr:imidazolonepropionase [Bacteroidota bacterium]